MTMEFFFPEDNLERAVPEETDITSLSVEPYTDGRRLHIHIEMTPFQKRPHLDVIIANSHGAELASANIVEPLNWKIEFTLHMRGDVINPCLLEARLFYPDGPTKEPQTFSFNVNPPQSDP